MGRRKYPSLWIYQTVGELLSLLNTGAAAHAALTPRLLLSRSAAVAAAVIHHVSPLFVPRDPMMVALAQQKIYSMIVIKTVGVAHRYPSMLHLPNQTTATCSNGSPQRDVSEWRSLRRWRLASLSQPLSFHVLTKTRLISSQPDQLSVL